MNKVPDYAKATNTAYRVLLKYNRLLPTINIFQIILCFSNIKLHTYSDACKKLHFSFQEFLDKIATSEYGYTIYDPKSQKYLIFYNDKKNIATIRFTLAHELGHVLLKHTVDDSVARKEASCFARNLLCPVPVIDRFNLQSIYE